MDPKHALQKAEDTLQEYNSSVPKSLFSLAPKPHGKGMKKVKSVKAKDGGTFEVYERPAKAGQDRYKMYHAFGTGRGLDLGTHPSADGALKFARNNGIIESNLKLAEARYDSYGYDVKDRWDGEKPRGTGRDYFGNKMRAEPEAAIFKTKPEAEKYAKKMGHKVAGKPFKNVGVRGEEWIVMVKEDLYEQIMEASSDKVLNQLIANLKKEMSKIDKIDPSSNAYKKMIKFLDATAKVNPQAMKTLADADVKFLSKLAKNRLREGVNESRLTMKAVAAKDIKRGFLKSERVFIPKGSKLKLTSGGGDLKLISGEPLVSAPTK
jgi:hypothetical protein